jgi:hypothetical protein
LFEEVEMKRSIKTSVLSVAAATGLSLTTPVVQAAGPFQYHPLTPCRIADTRGAQAPVMAPQQDRSFQVQGFGACGVPSGAKAVSLNITVTQPTAPGYLTLYPSNVTRPTNVSSINFVPGDTVANGAIVPIGPAGLPPSADLRVFAGTTGSVHVILDVSGYFQ